MPFKIWAIGEEVLAADFNDYVQEQVVAIFPNAAARDAAIPSPVVGQHSRLTDTNTTTVWTGAAWVTTSGMENLRIRGGVFNGTTDGGGALSIPLTPVMAQPLSCVVTSAVDAGYIVAVLPPFIVPGSNQIVVRAMQSTTGGPVVSGGFAVYWQLLEALS